MAEADVRDSGRPVVSRQGSVGRIFVRIAAAGFVMVGALAIAGPSWAGPLMGC
jgi:hypothetical protein